MTKLIVRFLAWVGLKQAMQDHVFNHKSYKENMSLAFTDSQGKKYFSFNQMEQMPLAMLEKLTELQEQMRCKVPGKDLDKWIECVEKAINAPKPKMSDIGYWVGVLKDRRTNLFEPTILMEIMALLYVREDENPCVYNAALHKEKFEMLWKDSKEGGKLYDFFQQAGLSDYMPLGEVTPLNWQEYLKEAMEKIEKFNSAVSRISTSVSALRELESSSEKT
jgi:hypothetical protein